MTYPAVESAIDAAYWFLDKAEDEKCRLGESQVQNMLFMAQMLFALAYNREMLVPSMFICDENGFSEPNLNKVLAQGRPFMPKTKLSPRITEFMEEIWKKYARIPAKELEFTVKNTPIYRETFKKDTKTLLDFKSIVESLNKNSKMVNSDEISERRKILLSQNGPVVVSKWHPRKVTAKTLKQGAKHV